MVDRLALIMLLLAQWLFGWTSAPADGRTGCSPTLVVMASDCGAACGAEDPENSSPGGVPMCPSGCWECVVLAPPAVEVPQRPALPELTETLPAPLPPVVLELAARGQGAFAPLETGPPRERRDRSRLCVWVI